MNKLLLLALAVLFFAPMASAQTAVSASANVIKAIEIAKDQDLDFGDVIIGNTASIAVDDAEATTLTITGEESSTVTVTFNTLTELTGATDTLPFTQSVAASTADTPGSASALSTGGTVSLDGTNGNGYIYLYGAVDASGDVNLATEAYSGTITFSFSYGS